MTLKERYNGVINYFKTNVPVAETELQYSNPFELIVAVILSAQCTDKRINQVTPKLFRDYPNAEALASASSDTIFNYIRSVSYPNNKAKHLVNMANMLLKDFNGVIPSDIYELVKLPGVGRKTANVVASVIYDKPAMAVDTHIFRVSNRLGLTKAKNPLQSEHQLIKHIPEQYIATAHHWLILHGRYTCLARTPKCETCPLTEWCQYFKTNIININAPHSLSNKKITSTHFGKLSGVSSVTAVTLITKKNTAKIVMAKKTSTVSAGSTIKSVTKTSTEKAAVKKDTSKVTSRTSTHFGKLSGVSSVTAVTENKKVPLKAPAKTSTSSVNAATKKTKFVAHSTSLKVGDKAPTFKTKDQNGKTISLTDLKGKNIVLYFYPKDNTPTCTLEACSLRDDHQFLSKKNFVVLGVSADDEKMHKKFATKFDLPFSLLADTDMSIIKSYDVWGTKQFMGRIYDGIIRTTFIINEKGIISHVITDVKSKEHGQQILSL